MENIYITSININRFRNINELDIELSRNTRKHLILTGNNGSGKTSLLELLVSNFDNMFDWERDVKYEITTKLTIMEELGKYKTVGAVSFSAIADIRKVLMVSLPAEHLLRTSTSPETTSMKNRYMFNTVCRPKVSVHQNILQTMKTMRIQQLEAKDSKNQQLFLQSEKWLKVLKRVLCTIYENQTIELVYKPMEYNYKISLDGQEFDLNQMADGFSAFFCIVSEIMEKMDFYTDYQCDYTLPCIAFIDELETHMHISMQKTALGFLTEMFPNVQFIVTTHSPFVISSIENAVVYDLSRRESLESSTQYSYESIVEEYYDIDMYSKRMKDKFDRYSELAFIKRSDDENIEFSKLRVELQTVSPAQKEIYIAFKNIEKKRKVIENG